MLYRRNVLQLTAAIGAASLLPPRGALAASAGNSSPRDLAEAQTIWARLNGDLSGRTVYFTTMGNVWGFKPQADDLSLEEFAKRAYGYAGVAARKMTRRADGAIVVRQKNWAFYRNPETELLSAKIPNRWTGAIDTAAPLSGPQTERVLSPSDAAPPKSDPYNMRVQKLGTHAFVTTSSMIRFQSGGISWFKLEGNLASHHCATKDLENPALTHIPNTYSQNLVAEWQTWTHMHGEPGHILFKGEGVPLFDAGEIPDELQRAIQEFFPGQMKEVTAWR